MLYIELLGAGLLLTWLVVLVGRWPGFGWTLVAAFVVVADAFPQTPSVGSIGSLTIYPEDVIAAVFGALAVYRVGKLRAALARPGLAVAVTVLLLLSALWGVASLGLKPAMVEFRQTAYLVTFGAWILSQFDDAGLGNRVRPFVMWTAWILTGVAFWHLVTRGVGNADLEVMNAQGILVSTRPLVSGQAALVAAAALAAIVEGRRHWRTSSMAPTMIFLAVVAISQQRTVWVATIAGLLLLLFIGETRLRVKLLAGAVAAVTGTMLLYLAGALNGLIAAAQIAVTSGGTYNDRTFGWASLIQGAIDSGPLTVIAGRPFGSGTTRINSNDVLETFAAHNWYVTLFLRIGLVGFLLVVLLLLAAVVRCMRQGRLLQATWLVTTMVFAWAYNLPWYLGAFLILPMRNGRGSTTRDKGEGGEPPVDVGRPAAQTTRPLRRAT